MADDDKADGGRLRRWLIIGGVFLLALLIIAAIRWRDDILRTALDPQEPFQTYDPPPAPDYLQRTAWALMPKAPAAAGEGEPAADVFFIYPTAYNGGRHWNAPIDNVQTNKLLSRVMLPNYAGPFVKVGRVFAPRYRQASLYTQLTLRDDAREARRFAYTDVVTAFRLWRANYGGNRPFIVAGVDQGGFLAARLVSEEIAPDPALRGRLVAAYLMNTVTPQGAFPVGGPIPACMTRRQAGCVVGWAEAFTGDELRATSLLDRAQVWGQGGELEPLDDRPALCVNPLLGAASGAEAPARLNLGAVNATGLDWSDRPAFLQRQVSAQCKDGLLRVSRPKSPSLKPSGSWADRLKAPAYNLFYADIETDAETRAALWSASRPSPSSAPNSSAGRSAPGR